ncbi:AraC family transcriptional regulator [Kerstersia gyiorum]|jgi:AraC-like DNA-binding protein|uniref:AraC family transcriptional regulator n=1 Tax=Kerstersia gyiorum TaxID=206506 RepID=UPI00242D3432|nr:helix-turn-helix transcriptional regulator [Kerstersia gyiorum]MCH4271175.1 helix-turn-helix transcriptional regulator [Kerstersia gyiorum]MCI1228390.1 helix-turn-helix transcriptional regulator [Kerstersia gyiorum]
MTWIAPSAIFDADAHAAPVVGIASELADHDSGMHSHARGQLLYARQGCIRIVLDGKLCLMPPSRAVWIPPHILHQAMMTRIVDYRSLYFRPDMAVQMPADVRVIEVSDLLRAVLEPMALAPFEQEWGHGRYAHLLALCMDEIGCASIQPMLLPMPADRRLAGLLRQSEKLPPALHALEQRVGASGKTISRIFRKETGMGYQQWRQQWRLMRAMECLATGKTIAATAAELEFSSDSVFIAFFRSMVGQTPGEYFRALPTSPAVARRRRL